MFIYRHSGYKLIFSNIILYWKRQVEELKSKAMWNAAATESLYVASLQVLKEINWWNLHNFARDCVGCGLLYTLMYPTYLAGQ